MYSVLHLELTSRCNKACWMCGRRKMEMIYPELCDWGDMPVAMVMAIAEQVPRGTVVQFHNNGEPLLYPKLGKALSRFGHCIRQLNTNGKLLADRGSEIIDNLERLTISVIPNDPEADEQYEKVLKFIEKKRLKAPFMVYRLLGDVDKPERWEALPGMIARRTLHSPNGSREYRKPPVIPEIGICLDLLTHLAVDRYGNISVCVRFDPFGELRIGNVRETSLEDAWNGPLRAAYLENHIKGRRGILPGCGRCEFWGVPNG